MTSAELVQEREKTHGPYTTTAFIAQTLKDTIADEAGYKQLSDCQRESLDMIFSKVARIIAGNATCRDHWDDIAGYAALGRDNG